MLDSYIHIDWPVSIVLLQYLVYFHNSSIFVTIVFQILFFFLPRFSYFQSCLISSCSLSPYDFYVTLSRIFDWQYIEFIN